MKSRKILFYVHFNKKDSVDDYVIYQLEQMRSIFDRIILISNSHISSRDKRKFDGLYDEFIQRSNTGYDFAAWRDGMNAFGWDKLLEYDELTVMNDTCFGPIYDFREVYKKMQAKKVDFWGMTINLALKDLVMDNSGNHIDTPIHIQSYYITFNKPVIKSEVFKRFWAEVRDLKDVVDVILNYEVTLTDLLAKQGFTYDAYYNAVHDWGKSVVSRDDADTSSISAGDMKKYNPGYTCTRPIWLLNAVNKYPFVKTKAILMASSQIEDIRQYLINNTTYPEQLLDSYIGSRYFDLIKSKDEQILTIQQSRTYKTGLVAAKVYRKIIRK